ncbi:hypothetical protein ACFFJY_02210 [Fictibacillus aquaticus]|uniref:Uncharacterized protein n=1 Tax=Fictibacillus aquaticus TaxID=2021314 RepID=A0A235F8J5_9BACL|nr:hypothetical protein [Fictibacillus aquaticus]OYD57519.1 hypothetical protein CGZ90_12665 [Fictibacillus aquaticus]
MEIQEKIIHTAASTEKVIDADYHHVYGYIAVVRKNRRRVFYKNSEALTLTTKISFSKVRWLTENTILLAETLADNDRPNIHIVSLEAGLLSSFHGGDCIRDVLVTADGIWISYFDQGVYGEGISTNGLVLFSQNGEVLYRYRHDNHNRVIIDDCYAICPGENGDIWLFPYYDFPLVSLHYRKNKTAVIETAEQLHGATAIAVYKQQAYFHGPYDSQNAIISAPLDEQSIHNKEICDIGSARGSLRGLPSDSGAAFINVTSKEVVLLSIL